jgi:RNA polymerase sigma factor (sigma-70 family)
MPPAAGTARDDLIRQLLPSVRRIANWHIRRVNSRAAIADDIYSAGLEGLVRGVDRYDMQQGEPKPYVERRINGEIVDYLRSQDHLTRHFRDLAKATGVEAWAPSISLNAIVRRNPDATVGDFIPDQRAEDLEAATARRHLLALVERAARALPLRTRDILRRHYVDEINMAQIGAAYGLTESRVCQLVHEAHARIREALVAAGVDVAPQARRPAQRRARRRRVVAGDDARPPRECSVCGGVGHRADNRRHRAA